MDRDEVEERIQLTERGGKRGFFALAPVRTMIRERWGREGNLYDGGGGGGSVQRCRQRTRSFGTLQPFDDLPHLRLLPLRHVRGRQVMTPQPYLYSCLFILRSTASTVHSFINVLERTLKVNVTRRAWFHDRRPRAWIVVSTRIPEPKITTGSLVTVSSPDVIVGPLTSPS